MVMVNALILQNQNIRCARTMNLTSPKKSINGLLVDSLKTLKKHVTSAKFCKKMLRKQETKHSNEEH